MIQRDLLHPLVGGHLIIWKGHLTIPKGHKELPGHVCFLPMFYVFPTSQQKCPTTACSSQGVHQHDGHSHSCHRHRSYRHSYHSCHSHSCHSHPNRCHSHNLLTKVGKYRFIYVHLSNPSDPSKVDVRCSYLNVSPETTRIVKNDKHKAQFDPVKSSFVWIVLRSKPTKTQLHPALAIFCRHHVYHTMENNRQHAVW